MFLLISSVSFAVQKVKPGTSIGLGDDSGNEISRFMKALNDRNPDVRSDAAYELATIGPDAIDAIPKLIEVFLRDPEAFVKDAAADALELIGLNDEVNKALLEAFHLGENEQYVGDITILLDKVNQFLH